MKFLQIFKNLCTGKHALQYFFHYRHFGLLELVRWYSTFFTRIILSLKGGKIGKACAFYGMPYIYLAPGSKLVIGDGFELRSSEKSNLIGISRRSMISLQKPDAEITIGDNCGFSSVILRSWHSIRIGNNVMIGANTTIVDSDGHSMNVEERYDGVPVRKPVIIEDNVFIGYSAMIMKGVTIGRNSIIGARSVVTKDVPANCIAAGNPCKVIRLFDVVHLLLLSLFW